MRHDWSTGLDVALTLKEGPRAIVIQREFWCFVRGTCTRFVNLNALVGQWTPVDRFFSRVHGGAMLRPTQRCCVNFPLDLPEKSKRHAVSVNSHTVAIDWLVLNGCFCLNCYDEPCDFRQGRCSSKDEPARTPNGLHAVAKLFRVVNALSFSRPHTRVMARLCIPLNIPIDEISQRVRSKMIMLINTTRILPHYSSTDLGMSTVLSRYVESLFVFTRKLYP